MLAERPHRLAGGVVSATSLAVVEHDRPVTDLAHEVGGVGDEENRAALALEARDPLEALARNASSPTASTSSTSRISGSTFTATANPSRTYMPDE